MPRSSCRAFADAYPQVSFHQFQNHQIGLIQGLRDTSFDIALTYDLAIPPDLEFVELAVLPPFAILAGPHPLARKSSVSLQELAPDPMILLDLPFSSDYFLSLFDKAGLVPRVVERTQGMAVLRSLVGQDFGYTIINIKPLSITAPDGKKLAFVPISGVTKPMRMGLLTASGAKLSLTVRAFVDHCHVNLTDAVLDAVTLRSPQQPR